MKVFLPLLFFLLFTQVHPQNKSIHQLDNENYGVDNSITLKESAKDLNFIPINNDAISNKSLSKAVFGYLPDWEYLSGSANNLRYDLLTHIACFDFTVSSTGSISNPAGWPWTDVINKAHQNGVKVIMTAVNFDKDEIRSIITNQTNKTNFFNNVKNKIATYSLDGINIDFEAPYNADRGSVMNNFMSELKNFIHTNFPGKEVSFASPAVNWSNYWDLKGLAESCDYLFIMGYDFFGSWSTTSGPSAPLTGSGYNITNTVTVQYSSVLNYNPDKLILGVPYFGVKFKTNSSDQNSSVINFEGSTRFSTTEPQSQVYGKLWSSTYQVSWYRWQSDNYWYQVWYDDANSLSLKYDLAINRGLKGIGMWALGYDGTRPELWNVIQNKFGIGQIAPPAIPTDFRITGAGQSSLQIDFDSPEGAESYILYLSKNGVNFIDSVEIFANSVIVEDLFNDSLYFFKVKARNSGGESAMSEVLAAVPTGSEQNILIVNGFDRINGTNNTFNYITKYGNPLFSNSRSFVSASNEAVFNNKISLDDFKIVIWILGDESTADETFNQFEQDLIKDYLISGGRLFISGSEIGWDLSEKGNSTDKDFYNNFLKAIYVSDAPSNSSATYYTCETLTGNIFSNLFSFNFDNGSHGTFDVDWPDAIKPAANANAILKFQNVNTSAGYAGIAYEGLFPNGIAPGKIVHFSIPFETIYPEEIRTNFMNDILNFFDEATGISEEEIIPDDFMLYQNYPNPFNPETKIKFSVPLKYSGSNIKLIVYDLLGREVSILVNSNLSAGVYEIDFNGIDFPSGVFFYSLEVNNYRITKKMTLLK